MRFYFALRNFTWRRGHSHPPSLKLRKDKPNSSVYTEQFDYAYCKLAKVLPVAVKNQPEVDFII